MFIFNVEPPEPAHAVKTLELLSQLDLEVHAVKCGRQHTLILTNNGVGFAPLALTHSIMSSC